MIGSNSARDLSMVDDRAHSGAPIAKGKEGEKRRSGRPRRLVLWWSILAPELCIRRALHGAPNTGHERNLLMSSLTLESIEMIALMDNQFMSVEQAMVREPRRSPFPDALGAWHAIHQPRVAVTGRKLSVAEWEVQ
jgi:hypothetical protein